ncbi:Thioredoxin-like protein [Pseudohyphozyma bogoriensis]|nr:Thioredoxin-like protein [Pseudohyphozyma bogoriensis]
MSSYKQPSPTELLQKLDTVDRDHYVIFYSSPEERGRPWCRDCENAAPIITKHISAKPEDSTVIFVGSREEWNDKSNVWRAHPYAVERVPTILKLVNGKPGSVEAKVASAPRIVEAEILEGSLFRAFLNSS